LKKCHIINWTAFQKKMLYDKAIIKRFTEGDAIAFDEIFAFYSKKLYHFALGLVKDRAVAEDIIQQVFVELWEKRGLVNINLSFENYIFTITYNSIRKYFRNKSIEIRVKDYLIHNSTEIIENTDSSVIYDELFELAKNTIEKLPPKRKIVYKLSRQEGMKINEIACKLNITKKTAENHLSMALKFLKKEIGNISLLTLLYYCLFLF